LSELLLNYEVGANVFVQLLLLVVLSVAFYNSVFILRNWDEGSATSAQYSLEKRSYLVVSVVNLALVIKIFLLPFFTYTINELSHVIPGAMCGAGVISANSYGEPLLALKAFVIVTILLWLSLNKEDLNSKGFKLFKQKFRFYLFIYLLVFIEVATELLYFSNLTTLNPVSCCSSLYLSPQNENPLPFNSSVLELVLTFYATYGLLLLSAYYKKRLPQFVLSLFFLYVSYYSIVYFFSAYVYQLPSHQCPYCLLQPEYRYLGYFLYSALILAAYHSLNAFAFKFATDSFAKSAIWNSVFVFFVSIELVIYLIINRTFL